MPGKLFSSFKVLFLLSCLLLAGCDKQNENQDKINVALSPDYPPFEYYKNGQIVGMDIDIINAIAKELGLKAEIQPMEFDSIIASLESGRSDMGISSITATPARKKNLDFSESYHVTSLAILTRAVDKISTLDQLAHKTVAAQTASIMEKYLKDRAQDYNFSVFSISNNKFLVEELRLGRVDAVLLEKSQAKAFASQNLDFHYHILDAIDEGYSIAFKKGSAWRDKINTALAKLEKEGVLEEIKERWLK